MTAERCPTREASNKFTRGAFQSEKPEVGWCETSDSSRIYGRVAQRPRSGFSGETHSGPFAGHSARFDSLIWNKRTAIAEAAPVDPAKTPARPRRLAQNFAGCVAR